ncbi:glycosyltransferase [Mucilaginibacter celer]|uniref:Glycosyltransferase n=2 Tax=Mucilaginibacter celer TaxID=2305508 RepID=A0A494W0P3_9SPHI|nr:glycosyltransferase [Mucilaginibacter celer]
MKRYYFPLGVSAMQQMDLTEYEVILQSTTHCAKYIKVSPGALVITYCHNPFRLVWSADSYEYVQSAGLIKKLALSKVISILKDIDKKYAQRSDWFITNAREVVGRIEAAYQPKNKIAIINPPVKCGNFYVASTVGDYYLVVSRFETYKHVDLVIEAFNDMPDKKLVIVGKGSRMKQLKLIAGKNITFLSGLGAGDLARLYANCIAFIFPQLEDYGITPLEANASGRPVIAYGKGGVLDTMIPYTGKASKATAVFFDHQTKQDLKQAIATFEKLEFDPDFIRRHAESFDEQGFIEKIRSFVIGKYLERKGITEVAQPNVPKLKVIA